MSKCQYTKTPLFSIAGKTDKRMWENMRIQNLWEKNGIQQMQFNIFLAHSTLWNVRNSKCWNCREVCDHRNIVPTYEKVLIKHQYNKVFRWEFEHQQPRMFSLCPNQCQNDKQIIMILLAKKQFLQQIIRISEKKIESFNRSLSLLSHNFDY